MSISMKVLSVASVAGLMLGFATPTLAQTTGTPPDKMAVPNSSTQVHCNPNGTGTVTNGANSETSTENTVPGTPVTSNNPSGQGTTTTQTPTVAKPTTATTAQCPKTAPAANCSSVMPPPGNSSMPNATTTTNGTTTSTTETTATGTTNCANNGMMNNGSNAAPMNSGGMMNNGTPMNALSNNPNGSDWLAKFNRPMVAATHKTKRMHHKRATGGGGHF